ncbi:MAG: nucleotide exchange factor GrpE [Bacteroidales bacterium]|nr:nucleotide exchange factor GrpE [Bacteroidales bacterium]MBN2698122.1 nucleotide exchange factor GrpE [Bacteroidales bacterium]
MDKKNQEIENQQDARTEPGEAEAVEEVKDKNKKDGRSKGTESKEEKKGKKEADQKEKLAELQDKYLRLSAEFDNYRKRTLKERIELIKTSNEELLSKILPVMDDFERAIQLIDEAKDIEAVKQGIHLIYGKFTSFLMQEGVKEIDALHTEFDTDIHEAITKIPAPEQNLKGKVVDVVQKGYYLNDKVMRFPKVVVGE